MVPPPPPLPTMTNSCRSAIVLPLDLREQFRSGYAGISLRKASTAALACSTVYALLGLRFSPTSMRTARCRAGSLRAAFLWPRHALSTSMVNCVTNADDLIGVVGGQSADKSLRSRSRNAFHDAKSFGGFDSYVAI